jgi:hypothetical protein
VAGDALPAEERQHGVGGHSYQAAEAVLAIPPMSEMYFFWSGNGRPETAVRGWRRSLEHVYKAADLNRNGKKRREPHAHAATHLRNREAQRGRVAKRGLPVNGNVYQLNVSLPINEKREANKIKRYKLRGPLKNGKRQPKAILIQIDQ